MLDSFTIALPVTIRLTTEADLPDLEWFGMFADQRKTFRETFDRQTAGEVQMFVAVAGGFPVGQMWVNLTVAGRPGVGYLYALRVLPPLQNKGIGRRLIEAGEAALRAHRLAIAEIGAGKDNPDALRLYERLGYIVVGEDATPWQYTTLDGEVVTVVEPAWILHKDLAVRPTVIP